MEADLGSSLPDPNKQVFPLLSPHPVPVSSADIYDETTPTPKATDAGNYSYGRSAIELPQIYDQSNTGGEEMGNVNKDALKPTLPNVSLELL